jgi:hypothetical protein
MLNLLDFSCEGEEVIGEEYGAVLLVFGIQ